MSDEQNQNEFPNPMDENRSPMIFYHVFMSILYGGIGIVIDAFLF